MAKIDIGVRERRFGMVGLLAGASLAALGLPAAAQTPAPAASAAVGEIDTVIVTARKRDEAISKVPISITAFSGQTLQTYNIKSFNDYATKSPNLSFSYGSGPTGVSGARTVAIRGITGQNLGGTSGATGFYIDDTPVPGSIDPRVLDIDNVEVLKGPQGTLFGESSLGGNVRLITKKADLNKNSFSIDAAVGLTSHGGSADGGVSFIGNAVVVPDKLALRVVGFYDHEAGYLTRTYPDPTSAAAGDPTINAPRTSVGDQGAETSYGGSFSARYELTNNFEARFRLMFQDQRDHGFPAAFAPLPDFSPSYTLDRAFNIQPTASDTWYLPSLDLEYKGQGWSVVSSTSYFHRRTQDNEDSTYGTEQILGPNGYYGVSGLAPQPYIWVLNNRHDQFTNETRVSFDPIHNLSGTLGFFYSKAHSHYGIPPTYANGLVEASQSNEVVGPWPNDMIWRQDDPSSQEDISVFGELYYKFLQKFTLTLGGRGYWLKETSDFTADGFMNFGATPSDPQKNNQRGFSPKVALAYQATEDAMVYASASKGFRAGGSQPFLDFCALPNLPVDAITNLKSDTLWTYEGGGKVQLNNPGILVSAAAFHIDWTNIQQQVGLPCGSYFEINGKAATVDGGELEASGHLTHELSIRLGLGYESTDITDPGALADVGVKKGSRIFGTPALSATLGAAYAKSLFGDVDGFGSFDFSYTGDSVSLLNGGSTSSPTATRSSYTLVDARFGVRWSGSEVAINLHNLTNAKPNLGDIGYVGYAQRDSAGSVIPQVGTLQPMTVTLEYRKTFF